MKKHLPNILTLTNLFIGCIGIVYAFDDNLIYACYTIWMAAIFDFLDGFTARLLKVTSPIGKQLDSLADMVTFGLLPSVILFKLMEQPPIYYLSYTTFILAIFSALRLAKFNIDNRQTNTFIGMPTPAAAFFVSGLPFWLNSYPPIAGWWLVILITFIISILLVSPLRMLALKFSDYSIQNNWHRYLLVILSIVIFLLFGPKSFSIIILLYTILSVITSRQKLQ